MIRLRAGIALCLVLVTASFALAGAASAASPSTVTREQYVSAIDRALADIAALRPRLGSSERVREFADTVRTDLGAVERVTDDGATFDARPDEIGRLLDRLQSASADGRSGALDALSAHLASLRLAVRGRPATPRTDPAALRRLLSERQAARQPGEDWLGERVQALLQRIADWLARLNLGGGRMSGGFRIVTWIVLAIPATIALVILVRALIRARRGTARRERGRPVAGVAMGPVVEAAEGLPDDPLAYADRLLEQGRTREAMRALYGGAARALADAGTIHLMRTRTNAELLRDVVRAGSGAAAPLATLTALFEAAWYGHMDPAPDQLSVARRSYGDIVREAAPSEGGAT